MCCRWGVLDIGDPYLIYRINVTVQQLDFKMKTKKNGKKVEREVWTTVGNAVIGPERRGDNTNRKANGKTSGPEVCTTRASLYCITYATYNYCYMALCY